MMMHGATNPRAKRRHAPPRNQPKKPAQLQEGDVTNLYGGVGVGFGIECCAAHKTTDKGDTSKKLVERSTRLRPRPDDGAC
jgi:hypothetical protein